MRFRRSSSTAAPSPRRSGAKHGVTTSSRTATSKTACRAAAPMCATARSSTSRFSRQDLGPGQRLRALHGRDHDLVPARSALEVRQGPVRRPDRLAGRAPAGTALEERDGRGHPAWRRALPQAGGDRDEVLLPRLGRHVQACRRSDVRCRCRLDEKPELLFLLRKVDHLELIAGAVDSRPVAEAGKSRGKKTIAAGTSPTSSESRWPRRKLQVSPYRQPPWIQPSLKSLLPTKASKKTPQRTVSKAKKASGATASKPGKHKPSKPARQPASPVSAKPSSCKRVKQEVS